MTSEQQRVEEVAGKLTKAARRAIPKLSAEWTRCAGRLRVDSYSLWWGKMHDFHLVDRPRWVDGDLWQMRLTPRGLAIQAHLRAKEGV